MNEVLIYIILVMIAYDLSLHVFDFLRVRGAIGAKHPLGAYRLFDYLSKGDKEKRKKIYNLFWMIYWAIALILLIVYLIRN